MYVFKQVNVRVYFQFLGHAYVGSLQWPGQNPYVEMIWHPCVQIECQNNTQISGPKLLRSFRHFFLLKY